MSASPHQSPSVSATRTQSLGAVWNIIEPAVVLSGVDSKSGRRGRGKQKGATYAVHDPQLALSYRLEDARFITGDAVHDPELALSYQWAFFISNEEALRILKRGISSQVIGPLSDYLAIGKGELVSMLDMDRTTALRRAGKDLPLPTHSAESVLRLLELNNIACDTFESDDAALGWLRRPHPMLDGESPLESAKTSFGSRRVKDMLVAIKHGGVV